MADGLLSFDDRDGFIWFDGRLVPWREAKVHVLTHGLHYASSVFEGQRVYDGDIFRLKEHTARLFASGRMMGFDVPYGEDEINRACKEVVAANKMQNGYMRPVAWRGPEQMGVSAQRTKIHVAIACWMWDSYYTPEAKMKGLRLGISDWRRPAPESAPVHAKAAGLYMICTLSKHKAEAEGYNDALMLDYRGQVAEATSANIFFVKDGAIHTPKPDCFLDGITRREVIGLARQRGIEVIERAIQPDEMAGFEQCFVTGTAVEIFPVGEIGPYNFEVGGMIRTLMGDFDTLTAQKTAA
jgi:branched-chain amino acid aminotransferase